MKTAAIAVGVFAAVLVFFAVLFVHKAFDRNAQASSSAPAADLPRAAGEDPKAASHHAPDSYRAALYGRIATVDGATYEGRLRWGGDEEASWGDYFNGAKDKNRWVDFLAPDQRPKEIRPISILGLRFAEREIPLDLGRRFMTRFGDVARIESAGRDVAVTLKSGTVFHLDRFEASDFDDGVRVWDAKKGVVDLDSLRIRSIELLPTPALDDAPDRLHGMVHTPHGEFTGFIQWNRQKGLASDVLDGRTDEREISLRFDTIRSIARRTHDSSSVTLSDGHEIVLSRTGDVSDRNHGIYVDDPRYGRVQVSWDAFERVDFTPGATGPAYGEFPPGRPLAGTVTTGGGRRLTGRLVYDLDESETVESFDAPFKGVDYSIPFGLVASIVLPAEEKPSTWLATVTLRSGEKLLLERGGDLGERNAGILVFVEGREKPEYVPWADVSRIGFDGPPAMYPPVGKLPTRSVE